jgi:phosphatidylglycerophosphate synthase
MGESAYQVTDRRPIAARDLGFFQRLAPKMARAGVSANSISVASGVCGILAGGALFSTTMASGPLARALWLAGAAFVQLRLVANLLDGMVAISGGKASAVGEMFNELPDRVSDVATLVGLGYAAGGMPVLGWVAAALALITAYVRTFGKSVGAGSDFCGPMAKQHRMFVVTMVCVFCGVAPRGWQQWRPGAAALAIIIAGEVVTTWRRISHIAGKLRGGS